MLDRCDWNSLCLRPFLWSFDIISYSLFLSYWLIDWLIDWLIHSFIHLSTIFLSSFLFAHLAMQEPHCTNGEYHRGHKTQNNLGRNFSFMHKLKIFHDCWFFLKIFNKAFLHLRLRHVLKIIYFLIFYNFEYSSYS